MQNSYCLLFLLLSLTVSFSPQHFDMKEFIFAEAHLYLFFIFINFMLLQTHLDSDICQVYLKYEILEGSSPSNKLDKRHCLNTMQIPKIKWNNIFEILKHFKRNVENILFRSCFFKNFHNWKVIRNAMFAKAEVLTFM